MLEKVIIRIIYNTSKVVLGVGVLAIIGPILLFIIVGKDPNCESPLKIYGLYTDIVGSYGFLKVLVITVIAGIINFSTEPFVEEKDLKEENNNKI